jgi:putative ATP-dependent endonuclease of OLD family
MHYITSALDHVNQELGKLSIHNEDQTVQFIAGESDAGKLLDNLSLAYSSADHPLTLGGDGRNNQIFLATWIAKQNIQKSIDHVTFYAIEEPEAHLHPHQQRKLSEYIQNHFNDQVFITSHSPHIASRFDPQSIVRLYPKAKYTHAACGGCSSMLQKVILDFGYRLNSLSAEVFFADGVFLVEGTSEVLFYHALARAISIDLDRLNVSIISVEGIGFKPYVAVCNALNIPWALRTDNDIFSKPTKQPTHNYYAGISRIMGILKEICAGSDNSLCDYWDKHAAENEWTYQTDPPATASVLNTYIRTQTVTYGLYVSDVDLESDLANSALQATLMKHYNKRSTNTLIKAMQTKKAENMMHFLSQNQASLSCLDNDKIASPLKNLRDKVSERIHPAND